MRVRILLTAAVLGIVLAACGGAADPHMAVLEDRFDVIDQILDCMEGVTDESSAKEAAKKIDALGAKMTAVQKRMQAMDVPTPDHRERLTEHFAERQADLDKRAQELGGRMRPYPEVVHAFAKAMQPLDK